MEWDWIRHQVGSRRNRAALGVLAFALCLVLGWALWRGADESQPAQAPLAASSPAADSAAAAEPAGAPASPVLAVDSDALEETQLCGGDWVKAGPDGRANAEDAAAIARLALDATRAKTLAAMAGGDERAQAAAHLYRRGLDLEGDCSGGSPCVAPTQSSRQAAVAELTALVQLAQGSTDPQVYAWALQACHDPVAGAESPCQLVTSEQWARLDPSNALPWLFMAADAEKRGDADGLSEAMFHVANAEREVPGWGSFAAELIKHAPPGEAHLAETFNIATEAIGVEAATSMPYSVASKYCSAGNLGDANRHETCEGVATVLAEKSNTLLERSIGLGMGKRLGWPQERIQSLEEERQALYAAVASATPSVVDESDCKQLHQVLDHFRDLGVYGELETARRAMAASGKTVSLLAADFRHGSTEETKKWRREEAAAASAASAASASEN